MLGYLQNVILKMTLKFITEKKRNEGKHHYAAIIACTTKLLRQILALCKQLEN